MTKIVAILMLLSTFAFAQTIEQSLNEIDMVLTGNDFDTLVKNCNKQLVFSRGNMETRESVEVKAVYKNCNSKEINIKYKTVGRLFNRTVGNEQVTRTEFYKHGGNMVRAYLQEMVAQSNGALSMDRFSVY
jgi:hypothetical protein